MKLIGYVASIVTACVLFLVAVVGIVSVTKCEHERVEKHFAFQFQDSTADSRLSWVCADCYQDIRRARFRGTPTDTSYLNVIAEHSDGNDIVGGEYYTMTVTVTLADHDSTKTRINCQVRNNDIVVGFSVEFKDGFEELVSSIQRGDEVTFRGKFYDVGCGFSDAELITE